MADVVLRGRFDVEHEKQYAHVPFEVPPGVRALNVSYDYSLRIDSDPTLGGGNTLDIGLFDARGIEPSSRAFRGWSGSNKLSFSIGESWATPPYLPGPIMAGTWHVLLGPYKVAPTGCEYEVSIAFGSVSPAGQARAAAVTTPKRRLAAPAEAGWLRGDLHCHTLHSDGDSWPADMLGEALERGLDFLGVTDHNGTSHHADYASVKGDDLPILLPGIEVTTYHGHWNAWGTPTWWDFREPTADATSRAMQAAAAAGALVSVNHPKPYGPAWEYADATGFQAIEVWNGPWLAFNPVSLAWWDRLLHNGRRVVALGGSDTHNLKSRNADPRHSNQLGSPTTWVHIDGPPTSEAVLAALKAGRAFVSRDPNGPQVYLDRQSTAVRVRAVGAVRAVLLLVSDRGVVASNVIDRDDWTESMDWPDARYVRAQLMTEHGEMLALTNPIFAT